MEDHSCVECLEPCDCSGKTECQICSLCHEAQEADQEIFEEEFRESLKEEE
jgi:hypothetical protein